MITGLHAERQARIDANYLGLWGGFYQSTQNRGSVVMAVMHIEDSENGLRCMFTEGKVSASGAAVAMGPRLHVILEIEPLHDRLCLFIFNGVLTPDGIGMDGVYMISAGDTSTCATASPIVLFRIGDTDDYARIGGLPVVMQSLYPVNAQNIQDSILAGDPIAGLSPLVPEQVLRAVCMQVGVPRADGDFDHVMRMPASRSLPQSYFGLPELPAKFATRHDAQLLSAHSRIGVAEPRRTCQGRCRVGPAPQPRNARRATGAAETACECRGTAVRMQCPGKSHRRRLTCKHSPRRLPHSE